MKKFKKYFFYFALGYIISDIIIHVLVIVGRLK